MPREVSRRTSKPPEQKARVSRPDVPGKRDLDPRIVEDREDPAFGYVKHKELEAHHRAMQTDRYLGQLQPVTRKGK